MGRRALPKIEADISAHFLTGDELPAVVSSVQLFPELPTRPLEIEVGSGKGLFLQRAAAAQPLHNFLGIEVIGKYARFAAARLATNDCKNVKMVHCDALQLFSERVPDESVHGVHVYFPDPWWKKRHRHRRVMNERFVADIQRVLLPGGRLHFWTDVQEYFEATLALIDANCRLQGPYAVDVAPAMHDLDYRTHFERRVRKNDLPVYRAEFLKPAWWTETLA